MGKLNQEVENTAGCVAKSIVRVELYIMFQTDLDFRANLDGLGTFVDSRLVKRLGTSSVLYDFVAKEIDLGADWDAFQLIRLSAELPYFARRLDDGHMFEMPFKRLNRASWAMNAVNNVLLPAYMWIFSEIGIGNQHCISSYFRTSVFDMLKPGAYPVANWSSSDFTDGVRLLPRAETMAGNYGGSWAQWRFVLDGAKDYGDYVSSIVGELEREYGDEE